MKEKGLSSWKGGLEQEQSNVCDMYDKEQLRTWLETVLGCEAPVSGGCPHLCPPSDYRVGLGVDELGSS